MNIREKINNTLNFKKCSGGVIETFFPWGLTLDRFQNEGLPTFHIANHTPCVAQPYFDTRITESVFAYEQYLGFDPLKRMFLQLPFNNCKIDSMKQWETVKDNSAKIMEKYYTDENIEKIFGGYKIAQENGDFAVMFGVQGFFWVPRDLFGIEEHMFALYDYPEIIHSINDFVLEIYLKYMEKITKYIKPDIFYIMEDLSGANGPMISQAHFREYIGDYYKKFVPFLKANGVENIFVDTDGDFSLLIPDFMSAGIDGFLPMDVNAGMDIVALRRQYPTLKFIGSFNKLEIAKGENAINREFNRLLPVIKQGGYLVGSDHQVAPSTSLCDYKYYIKKLKEYMNLSGCDNN